MPVQDGFALVLSHSSAGRHKRSGNPRCMQIALNRRWAPSWDIGRASRLLTLSPRTTSGGGSVVGAAVGIPRPRAAKFTEGHHQHAPPDFLRLGGLRQRPCRIAQLLQQRSAAGLVGMRVVAACTRINPRGRPRRSIAHQLQRTGQRRGGYRPCFPPVA